VMGVITQVFILELEYAYRGIKYYNGSLLPR
jgi:hypothetical protein